MCINRAGVDRSLTEELCCIACNRNVFASAIHPPASEGDFESTVHTLL